MREADLPVDPPVPLGSMVAYTLASMRKYVQMAVFEGASEDMIVDCLCDALDRTRRAETTPAPVVLEAAT